MPPQELVRNREPVATVVPYQPSSPLASADPVLATIAMIDRVARDPSIDVARLKELLDLRARLITEEAAHAFNVALSAAQADMRPIVADKDNKQTRSTYASYAALDDAVRPIYVARGFSLTFNTGDCPLPDHVRVLCDVALGRHVKQYRIDIPADGKGAKGGDVMTRTHATMAAVSYGKTGLLKMIFNLAIRHDRHDDDGNAAGGASEFITAQQVAELEKLIRSTGGDVAKFCTFAKVERLADIYASRFEAAKAAIVHAGQQRKSQGARR